MPHVLELLVLPLLRMENNRQGSPQRKMKPNRKRTYKQLMENVKSEVPQSSKNFEPQSVSKTWPDLIRNSLSQCLKRRTAFADKKELVKKSSSFSLDQKKKEETELRTGGLERTRAQSNCRVAERSPVKLQPVVLLEKLNNDIVKHYLSSGSSKEDEGTGKHADILKEGDLACGRKRKFFSGTRERSLAFDRDCKQYGLFPVIKFWGKKSINSTEKENNNKKVDISHYDAVFDSLRLASCKDKSQLRNAIPKEINQNNEYSNILKEISVLAGKKRNNIHKDAGRRVSPTKDSPAAKIRKLGKNVEAFRKSNENLSQMSVSGQLEVDETPFAGFDTCQTSNDVQLSLPPDSLPNTTKTSPERTRRRQNIVLSESATTKVDRADVRLDKPDCKSGSFSSDDDATLASLAAREAPLSCDTATGENSSYVAQQQVPVARTSDVGCQTSECLLLQLDCHRSTVRNMGSPSLQPRVHLKKLTEDTIKLYTSPRHKSQEQICGRRVGSERRHRSFKDSTREFIERVFARSSWNTDQNNCPPGTNGILVPQAESGEASCGDTWGPYVGILDSLENSQQNGRLSDRMCIVRRESSCEEIVKQAPMTDTGKEDLIVNALTKDKWKCCRNEECSNATPELIGLENPITTNRCWMNVTLQTLFSMEYFMNEMAIAFRNVEEENSLISCLLRLYVARSLGHQDCVYKEAREFLEMIVNLNNDYTLNAQQDPSEFIFWLFSAFETTLEKYGAKGASNLITKNFQFEMEERVCCTSCLNMDVKSSSFLILLLDIRVGSSEISSIEEALAKYTATKFIKKKCSKCEKENSLVKTVFKSTPRYLIINLKRYSIKGGQVVREETAVSYPRTLSLGKYSDPVGPRQEAGDKSCVSVVDSPSSNTRRKGLCGSQNDYSLISVIHHAGFSVSSGHYVCDVYNVQTDKWYSYNDKMVKELNPSKLLGKKRQKTGYIYVYSLF